MMTMDCLVRGIAKIGGVAALVLGAWGALASEDRRPVRERVWVEVEAPGAGSVERAAIPLVELRGRAGASAPERHDVAIVIDLSSSTRLPSGVDVDGDGVVGASRPEVTAVNWGTLPPEVLCDDPADTIAGAEIAAVARLLEGFDGALIRIAIVAFGDADRLEAPLGSSADVLGQTLARLDGRHGWYGGTNFAAALRGARAALQADSAPGRRRSVLLLTDGYPTLPAPEPAPHERAVAEAESLARERIPVIGFALGPEALRERKTLDAIVKRTAGELVELDRPGDVLYTLPYLESRAVREIRIENLTHGSSGRAIRMLAGGHFDGFVTLAAGVNRIRVRAVGEAGGQAEVEREIVYAPPQTETRELELERARLAERLRQRTLEVRLVEEMRREKAARSRNLSLEAEH